MLSYQHGFHAGNAADVHKHALLSAALAYMTQKDKPITYLETHAGRGLYDLAGPQAVKTGEAAAGIKRLLSSFAPDHPYRRALESIRKEHGPDAYPGSPLLASQLLRHTDSLHLAELHPQEFAHLERVMRARGAPLNQTDGFALAQSLCPPTPRRGMILIDPPYEIKKDYETIPKFLEKLHAKWNVGVIALWYPMLASGAHAGMARALDTLDLPGAMHHQVTFAAAKEGHGMIGSGMFFANTPYGLADEATRLTTLFT